MIIGFIVVLLGIGIAVEYAWLKWNGSPVAQPNIAHSPQTIGSGTRLTYAILGDSTAIAQGATYNQGYAVATAHHLANRYRVTWVNFAVSGARAQDVVSDQAGKAGAYKPDVVLIAVAANDVTHVTAIDSVRSSLTATVQQLRQANSDVRIILTGSPDMGAIPRIPQPLRLIAGIRTNAINAMITQLAYDQKATFAPIAERTGPAFRAHPELFASDNFHPNASGYELWTPVLNAAIDQALHR